MALFASTAAVAAGCSNGNADSTQHGFDYEAGAPYDTGTADSTNLGDVVLASDTSPDTQEPPPDSMAPADSAPADTGSVADAGADANGDSRSPEDSGAVDSAMDSALADSGAADSTIDSTTPPSDTGTVVEAGGDAADTGGGTGNEAGQDGAGADGGCTSTMAILGGSSSTAVAVAWRAGTWTGQTLTGSVVSVPGLASNGSAYVGVVQFSSTNYVEYTVSSGTSWSAFAGVPGASGTATTIGPPALASIGSAEHLVYIGTDSKFYHGVFSAGAWTPADDPVQASGGTQSFGPSAPTAAGLSAGFSIAQAGMDSHVYAQPWDGQWGSAVQVATDVDNVISPRIVSLTGGSASQMIVYSRNDNNDDEVLMYSVLTGSTWSSPVLVQNSTVLTPDTVSIAPLANGGAILVFEGMDGHGYYTTYNPTSAPPWATVAPLYAANNPSLAAPPQVAPGVCGADAILVFATTAAGTPLYTTTFVGSTWSAFSGVPSTVGATFAAIATQP
jgi:hypothetical protein